MKKTILLFILLLGVQMVSAQHLIEIRNKKTNKLVLTLKEGDNVRMNILRDFKLRSTLGEIKKITTDSLVLEENYGIELDALWHSTPIALSEIVALKKAHYLTGSRYGNALIITPAIMVIGLLPFIFYNDPFFDTKQEKLVWIGSSLAIIIAIKYIFYPNKIRKYRMEEYSLHVVW